MTAVMVYDWAILLASWGLILGGSAFVMIGAFGMLRFPDFWARLHAASVSESAGMLLLIAGMALQSGWSLVTLKLVFIALLVFITGPTATHAVANAALVSGLRPRDDVDGVEGAFPDPEAEP